MRRLRIACGLALAASLGGCAVIPGFGPPPIDAYELGSPRVESGRRLARTQILVAEPGALKVFDGENIVVRTQNGAVQFLSGARWADNLPKLVQAKLSTAFQSTDALGGVGTPGDGLAIDYQIIPEIRAFEIRVDGNQTAFVEIYVRVLNDRTGVVRASHTFVAGAPVSGSGNNAYFRALDDAFQIAAADIVSWSLDRL
ncbi:ABC-type transport auxiliary lipoprotein family protein [Nitratireductor luteus]|uniref:ABC-type transport auxiliary lipoprotein family protein n=1 Tax=Nitratireductor luteus TaxID=2976980 RepID=UPI002240A9D4|nr:ABC-type transport auxiliary lipoprotein family protein [Nitratireductor luteus]